MTTPKIQIIKLIYYAVSIAFHLILWFTNVGNYFHGGTVTEWVAMQSGAVLIALTAVRLIPTAKLPEKICIAMFAVVPVISIAWSLKSMFE